MIALDPDFAMAIYRFCVFRAVGSPRNLYSIDMQMLWWLTKLFRGKKLQKVNGFELVLLFSCHNFHY